ncbi:hypothetical protein VTN77DRAFT_7703 [Rasamsonia byssochlamydoides]|uniref:uncharacterized protein n=1 Tax=Rasamsonia byssochlamydoides TaxID=89139 RepID=UPI0037434FF8
MEKKTPKGVNSHRETYRIQFRIRAWIGKTEDDGADQNPKIGDYSLTPYKEVMQSSGVYFGRALKEDCKSTVKRLALLLPWPGGRSVAVHLALGCSAHQRRARWLSQQLGGEGRAILYYSWSLGYLATVSLCLKPVVSVSDSPSHSETDQPLDPVSALLHLPSAPAVLLRQRPLESRCLHSYPILPASITSPLACSSFSLSLPSSIESPTRPTFIPSLPPKQSIKRLI